MPVALLGTTDAALEAAAASLAAQVPNLQITCKIAPPMGFDPDSEEARRILHQVRDSGARLCFLASWRAQSRNGWRHATGPRHPRSVFASIRGGSGLSGGQSEPRAGMGAQDRDGMGMADAVRAGTSGAALCKMLCHPARRNHLGNKTAALNAPLEAVWQG